MPRSKRLRTLLLSMLMLVVAAPVMAGLAPGERVWIGLYSDNLREDGYAIGTVEQVLEDGRVQVAVRELVKGEGRTLYGTCSPGASNPLAGAEIVEDDPGALLLRKAFEPEQVQPWRAGRDGFLARENAGAVFYKWLGGAMGVTEQRCRRGQDRVAGVGFQRAVKAFEVACRQVASTGGSGFPVPVEQRLGGAAAMLADNAALLAEHPGALAEMQAIVAGEAGLQGEDLLAIAGAGTLKKTAEALATLREEAGGIAAARERVADLPAIFHGYVDLLTGQGSAPFGGQAAEAWHASVDAALAAGEWPRLPRI